MITSLFQKQTSAFAQSSTYLGSFDGSPLFSYAPTFINRQISLDKNNVKSKMGIKESQRRKGSLKIMGF